MSDTPTDGDELSNTVRNVLEVNPGEDSVLLLGMLVDGVLENRHEYHPSDVKDEIQRQLNNRSVETGTEQ